MGYEVDPANPYPEGFTGHVRVKLKDGSIVEERQPHLRGGAKEPLTRQDLEEKFRQNCAHGGWPAAARRRSRKRTRSMSARSISRRCACEAPAAAGRRKAGLGEDRARSGRRRAAMKARALS